MRILVNIKFSILIYYFCGLHLHLKQIANIRTRHSDYWLWVTVTYLAAHLLMHNPTSIECCHSFHLSATPFVHLIDCVTNHNARGLYSGFQRDKTKCINFKRWWLSNLNNVIKIYNVTILNHLFSIFSVLAIHSYIYHSVITFLTYRKRYYKIEGVVGHQKWSDRNTCIFS